MRQGDPYDVVIGAFTKVYARYEKVGFERLTIPERVIFCTWQFHCEVNNGGFHQFFSNPSPVSANQVLAALEAIPMPFAASLLRRALEVFPEHDTPRAVWGLPEAIRNQLFDELTGLFYDAKEDQYQLQAEYIERNREKFSALHE